MRGVQDPYRELGVPRGATDEQVKAAHRRFAKRYHPDSSTGDQVRFLAVQEAYLVLSDPIRRRDWDSRHAPGPVRATERPVAPRRAGPAHPPTSNAPPVRRSAAAPDRNAPPTSASGRDPGVRSTTWSAQGVPWWEDFGADGVRRGSGPASGAGADPSSHGPGPSPGTNSRGPGPGPGTNGAPRPPSAGPGAGDIYARSSGAAWSSAARRHFRKDEADLPRGGAFRYRGTQVITGAEARQDAAAEARRAASPANGPRPATAPQLRPRPVPSAPDSTSGLMSRLRRLLGGS
ncbi:MAG: DnaJ domain-containing protein [Chloroflexi bacterium]|nr:DnaJ domain-containing protein [Chloroflexota bacterium]